MRFLLLNVPAVIGILCMNFPATAADNVRRGEVVYKESCIACHGDDGSGNWSGVPDLTEKKGVLAKRDAVLLKHMVNGFQSPGSPMAMPARGGDPTLTEADLKAALKYMRKEFLR